MVQNFSVYNETQPEPLKAIVIVIDQYEVIKELGESVENFIQKVSRDGAGLGIYLAVSTSRDGAMRSAARNNFKVRIGGFNFDESELSSFVGRSPYKLPEEYKGRALVKTDSLHVMQLYTPVPFETEKEYNQNLKELISEISQKSSEEKAKKSRLCRKNLPCQCFLPIRDMKRQSAKCRLDWISIHYRFTIFQWNRLRHLFLAMQRQARQM